MNTFDDKIFKWSPIQQQQNIIFFWPLTEQIPLDLDYKDCDVPKLYYPLNEGTGNLLLCNVTNSPWVVTNIQPQLTVSPNNPVGTLSIGGVNIGLEKKPNFFQKLLHKLLGFDWKDK